MKRPDNFLTDFGSMIDDYSAAIEASAIEGRLTSAILSDPGNDSVQAHVEDLIAEEVGRKVFVKDYRSGNTVVIAGGAGICG